MTLRRKSRPPLRVATRLLRISDPELLLDLRDAYLRNADLSGLRKSQVLTDGANLVGARLPRDA